MKKTIYSVSNITSGDEFGGYFDNLKSAKNEAESLWNRKGTHSVWLMKLNVEVPDDYNYTTAEQFYKDLVDEEIKTSDFRLDLADWDVSVREEEINVPDATKYYVKNIDGDIIEEYSCDDYIFSYIHEMWDGDNDGVRIENAWGEEMFHRVFHEGEPDVDEFYEDYVLCVGGGYYFEWE